MTVAILTKYLGATNSRPSRVKAYTESGLQVTIPWEYGLNVEGNHLAAAQKLAHKMDWAGRWVGGGTKEGYAFVNVNVDRAGDATFSVIRRES